MGGKLKFFKMKSHSNDILILIKTMYKLNSVRKLGSLTSKPYPLSYVHHSSPQILYNWNLGQMFDLSVQKFGEREAMVFKHQNIRKSYKELRDDVNKFASGLLAIGLKPGNLVGIWSFNCYEWIVTQYAVAKCGMILVHLSAVNQVLEMSYCLKKVSMQAIVISDIVKDIDYYKILSTVVPALPNSKPGLLECKRFTDLKHVIIISNKSYPGTWKYSDIFSSKCPILVKNIENIQAKVQPDAPSNIMFTSGTAGLRKATVVTHHGLVNNAVYAFKRICKDMNQTTRICFPLPLYHSYGCSFASIGSIALGFCSVFPSFTWNVKTFAEVAATEKCTQLFGTPTMYCDLLNLPDINKYDFSNVKLAVSGGSDILLDVAQKTRSLLNCPVVNGYGCTEATCSVLVPRLSDSTEIQAKKGYPLDHLEVKVVDENGNIVPRNIRGELLVRGYSVMLGYWNDDDKTKEVILKNRWYRTGDRAVIDDNGYVEIVGRMKDVINRGGDEIYPKEVENYLLSNLKIAEVKVFGVDDKRYGEEVCAWIKLKKGQLMDEEEVKYFCMGQISHIKVPKYIFFVDSFPRNHSGKYLKSIMREESMKKLGIRKRK